jgi:homoserine O-acetyltransferase
MKETIASLFIVLFISCSPAIFKSEWTKEMAPAVFMARFETSKGNFDIEVTRKLSPKAVDRFYQLVKYNYFDNGLFYRVNPGFVAQFGNSDRKTYEKWYAIKVPDEVVIQGNKRGTLSFGRGGKESRSADLYINLSDNFRLDTLNYNEVRGFPTFGEVVKGMNVVDSLYSGYADTTMEKLDIMYADRDKFLEEFPQIDTLKKVYLVNISPEKRK